MPIVDLVNSNWTLDDFNKYLFQKRKSEGLQDQLIVNYTRKEDAFSSLGRPLKGVTAKIESEEASNLINVTEAFDTIVKGELAKEAAEIEEPVQEQAKKVAIDRQIQVLSRLISNLQAHDAYIQEFNKRHFSHCPTHEETIKLIQTRFEALTTKKRELKDALVDKINHLFENLQEIIGEDKYVDWHYLIGSYRDLMRLLASLDPPEERVGFQEEYQELFNHFYIESIATKGFQLPKPIELILLNLGFSPQQIHMACTRIAGPVTAHMLPFASTDLSKIEVPKLKHQIQRKIFFLIGKELGLKNKQRKKINETLNLLNQAEPALGYQYYLAINRGKNEMKRFVEQQIAEPVRGQFIERLDRSFPPSSFENMIVDFLKDQNLKQILSKEKKFSKFLQELDAEFYMEQQNIKSWLEDDVAALKNEFFKLLHQTVKEGWIERNARYRRFGFWQGGWGDNHILGGGVCAAINYRWIRELLKDPFKKITSYKDLDPDAMKVMRNPTLSFILTRIQQEKIEESSAVHFAKAQLREKEALTADELEEFEVSLPQPFLSRHDSSIGVKPEDRRIQAQYIAEAFDDSTGAIPKQVLAKDHMQVEPMLSSRPSTISELIERVVEKSEEDPFFLRKSSGIFGIGIRREIDYYDEKEYRDAHAVGMQIDQTSHVYRFWDVNSGFYSYPDLATLKREAEAYIQEYYGRDQDGVEYNDFLPIQYFKKE